MTKILAFLKGKKTYGLVVLALIVIGLNLLGYISVELANTLLGLLGFGAFATLRSSVGKKK
jgi:hypothetical protein